MWVDQIGYIGDLMKPWAAGGDGEGVGWGLFAREAFDVEHLGQ